MLHRALGSRASLLTLAFARQYPQWLYPGRHDRDPDLLGVRENGVVYLLDSANPVTWVKALRRILEFAPDLVIIPWWHVYWTPCFGWLATRLQRSGIEILFLCHNVFEHHGKGWTRFLSKVVLSRGSRYIVHSQADRSRLAKLLPKANISVHPIPLFDSFPNPRNILPRQSPTEFLFFGFIRPYKGLDVLLKALALLKNCDFHLTVVGEFWRDERWAARFVERSGLGGKVEFVPRYVSDVEAAEYFARSDAVILPYRTATSSAVVALAYHYNKPVIASDVGGLPDVVEHGATGLLVKPGSPQALAEALLIAMDKPGWHKVEHIADMKQRLTWDSFVTCLIGE